MYGHSRDRVLKSALVSGLCAFGSVAGWLYATVSFLRFDGLRIALYTWFLMFMKSKCLLLESYYLSYS